MTRARFRGFQGALLALLLAACAAEGAQGPVIEDQWRSITLNAEPVSLGAEEVGRLRFRGGLALSSSDAGFGGLSGMEIGQDGRLLAVSDRGEWFSAKLRLDEAGGLIGLEEPRLALLRDLEGETPRRGEDNDAEGVAQLPDGRYAVSFEHSQTIRIYDFNRDGPFGAASPGPPLGGVERLAPNGGLEALAVGGDGDLIIGAERVTGRDTWIWRTAPGAHEPAAPQARYALAFGFALVGLDRLPNGDMVALERFYMPTLGARSRIVSFSEQALDSASGEIDKQEWALLEGDLALDNFEAISAVQNPDGGARLYIVSDDNFSPRQRTLLYAFDVKAD